MSYNLHCATLANSLCGRLIGRVYDCLRFSDQACHTTNNCEARKTELYAPAVTPMSNADINGRIELPPSTTSDVRTKISVREVLSDRTNVWLIELITMSANFIPSLK